MASDYILDVLICIEQDGKEKSNKIEQEVKRQPEEKQIELRNFV